MINRHVEGYLDLTDDEKNGYDKMLPEIRE